MVTADSGTGGLVNTSFAGFLRGWDTTTPHERTGDGDRTQYWPMLKSSVPSCVDNSPQGTNTATYEVFDVVLRVEVITKRDQGFNIQDRILARLRAVFNRVIPTALVDTDDATRTWYFQPFQTLGPATQGPPTQTELRAFVDYRMTMTKGATAIP